MNTNSERLFEEFLQRYDAREWAQTIEDLTASIHEVDRHATLIWFSFFPLSLARALQQAEDPAALARQLSLQGTYLLRDQIDSSHKFLYGHRYWPQVKKAVSDHAASFDGTNDASLADQIREAARRAASQAKVDVSLLVGITAAAFMTAQQAGVEAFKRAPGGVSLDAQHARKSPAQVLRERARDDGQGWFGFLRTADKLWTVVHNENDETARFRMLNQQEVASAAATDKRDWWKTDARCTINEGPIPVQCRSASCGTCWIGVLGGAEKLSDVAAREGKQMKEFGYIDTDEPKPLIRLACQAQGAGALSIVIPPWNGVFGKYLRRQQQQPQHTAAPEVESISR